MKTFLPFIIVFFLTWLITWTCLHLLLRWNKKLYFLDLPNNRSLHNHPVSRVGGLCIFIGMMGGIGGAVFLGIPLPQFTFILGGTLIFGLGLIDDWFKGLPALLKLMIQCVIIGCIVLSLEVISGTNCESFTRISVWSRLISMLFHFCWIMIVINLINFNDGIDGYVGTHMLFIGLIVFLSFYSDSRVALIGILMFASSGAFLIKNWSPAKVFLGDAGSYLFGYICALLPFQLQPRGTPSFLLAMCFLLWSFLSDGIFTLSNRFRKGENVFMPHRTHLYQRLVQTGLNHDQVVLFLLKLSIPLHLTVYLMLTYNLFILKPALVFLGIILFLIFYFYVLYREQKKQTSPPL